MAAAGQSAQPSSPAADTAKKSDADVKELYEQRCSECHELTDVTDYGGATKEGWAEVVRQMVEDEEAELTPEEARLIVEYLAKMYPKS